MNRLSTTSIGTSISASAGLCALAVLLAAGILPVNAQVAGPMRTPAPSVPPPSATSKPEAPPIPPEEMIRRFAANEDEMLRASLGYGFDKSVRLQEIGPDNKPAGQVEIITQQIVGPDGKHYEKTLHRTESTLQHLQAERGDFGVIDAAPLFPFNHECQIPKYEITYQGSQPLDELSVYIFAVKPRALDRTHAYFSGVVWASINRTWSL